MRSAAIIALLALLAPALGGCAGRARDVLMPVTADVAGAHKVDMLVATTRSAAGAEPGEMFTGERAKALSFAEIAVSLPPDAVRKVGDVQWPSGQPGDPTRDFVTTRAEAL